MRKIMAMALCLSLLWLPGMASAQVVTLDDNVTLVPQGGARSWTGKVVVEDPDEETIWEGVISFSDSTVIDDDGDEHYFSFPTALGALDEASKAGGFTYEVEDTVHGLWVDSIAGYENWGSSGWMYKVDDEMPAVSADEFELVDGIDSEVKWYWASM